MAYGLTPAPSSGSASPEHEDHPHRGAVEGVEDVSVVSTMSTFEVRMRGRACRLHMALCVLKVGRVARQPRLESTPNKCCRATCAALASASLILQTHPSALALTRPVPSSYLSSVHADGLIHRERVLRQACRS